MNDNVNKNVTANLVSQGGNNFSIHYVLTNYLIATLILTVLNEGSVVECPFTALKSKRLCFRKMIKECTDLCAALTSTTINCEL
mgnify:CR=1 FL=1